MRFAPLGTVLLACACACTCGGGRGGGAGQTATSNTTPTASATANDAARGATTVAPPAGAPGEKTPMSNVDEPRDADGRTPLHDASQAGDLAKMRALLDAGANTEAVENIYHDTPMLLALEYGEPEAALLLLQRGASTAGTIGSRALALAARGGSVDVIDALLARGVEPAGTFALHAAAKYGHDRAIARLLAAGEPVDEVEPDDQWTPLLIACMENKLDAARVLLDAGASVKVRDDDGNMPLHWAVFGARPHEIHEYAELGGPHDTHFEPQDDAPLVELLLARGAPIDARDGDGDTALVRATMYEAANAVEVLLARGADRKLKNREGKTALDIATARGYAGIVARLKRR